jgi:peptidoglycan hydrolase-like protein with peptidoglycan-binding domain
MSTWKTRAAEYHRESARILGWDVRRNGPYLTVDSLALPGPVSDYQAAHGIAPDGRIGPDTLRSMIAVSQIPGPKTATEVVVQDLDLTRANPDAGTPIRPGAQRQTPPSGVILPDPPYVVPPSGVIVPSPPLPTPSKKTRVWVWLAAAALAGGGVLGYRRWRARRQ